MFVHTTDPRLLLPTGMSETQETFAYDQYASQYIQLWDPLRRYFTFLYPPQVSPDSYHHLRPIMELLWTSFLPLVYSTSMVLIELYLRVLDCWRCSLPYLSYKLYLLANFMLWLSCVALVAVALYGQAESVSIALFQVVWMQGSILGVGVIILLY